MTAKEVHEISSTSENGMENEFSTYLCLRFGKTDQPLVNINLNGLSMTALCNTGCNLNLISEKITKKLYMKLGEVFLKIFTANGEQLQSLGKFRIEFNLNSQCYGEEFIVVRNIAKDCILGTPFLKNNDAFLSLKNDFSCSMIKKRLERTVSR